MRAQLLLLMALAVVIGCRSSARVAGSSSPSAMPSATPLAGTRAEIVAQADALAVAGSHKDGEEAFGLTRKASELRRQLWRLEGREADALEALELLRGLEQKKGDTPCMARVDRALLDAELHADPSAAYRDVYRARIGAENSGCRERADRA